MSDEIKNSGLAMVLMRNAFYRDSYRRVAMLLTIIFFINCGLVVAIIYKYLTPPQPQYFAATAAGRIIEIHKLTDPTVSDQDVIQFVTNGVQQAFSLDYIHWRQQLNAVNRNYFSPEGFRDFFKALMDSNNLNTLIKYKMVSSATLTAAPQITSTMIVGGHYAWKVNMPLLITFDSSATQVPKIIMNVSVIVMRMPVQDFPAQIAITNFLPEIQGQG